MNDDTAATTVHERVRQAMNPAKAEAFERDPAGCRAVDCPCRGTVDLGNSGRFYCAWHAWSDSAKWPPITDELIRHRWMLDHIGELQRLHRAGGKATPWAHAADAFWTDPVMKPNQHERGAFEHYVWRLREELAFRVGSRKDRPAPLEPQAAQDGWKRSRDLFAQSAAAA